MLCVHRPWLSVELPERITPATGVLNLRTPGRRLGSSLKQIPYAGLHIGPERSGHFGIQPRPINGTGHLGRQHWRRPRRQHQVLGIGDNVSETIIPLQAKMLFGDRARPAIASFPVGPRGSATKSSANLGSKERLQFGGFRRREKFSRPAFLMDNPILHENGALGDATHEIHRGSRVSLSCLGLPSFRSRRVPRRSIRDLAGPSAGDQKDGRRRLPAGAFSADRISKCADPAAGR